jgi:hypothetical protein
LYECKIINLHEVRPLEADSSKEDSREKDPASRLGPSPTLDVMQFGRCDQNESSDHAEIVKEELGFAKGPGLQEDDLAEGDHCLNDKDPVNKDNKRLKLLLQGICLNVE